MQNNNKKDLHKKLIKLTQDNFELLESLSSHIILSDSLTQNAELQNFKEIKQQYECIVKISQESVAKNEELENELHQKTKLVEDLQSKILHRNHKVQDLQEEVEKASFTLKREKKIKKQISKIEEQNKNLKDQLRKLKEKRKQMIDLSKKLQKNQEQLNQKCLTDQKEVEQILFNRGNQEAKYKVKIVQLEATLSRFQVDLETMYSKHRPASRAKDNQKTRKIQDIQLMIRRQLQEDYQ